MPEGQSRNVACLLHHHHPLTVGLRLFREYWAGISDAAVMGSAPLIMLSLLAQRHLVRGISLKGR
jgi:ABC-type glycerol-3-phosphate transport system permease component